MAAPVLEIDDLEIQYVTERGALPAVRGVSLVIQRHDSLGLVGESGSGKSTLALGAVRYLASNGRVTRGSVRLNGVSLLDLSPGELRKVWGRQVGVVYQNPLSALNPSMLIGRQLAEIAHLHLDLGKREAEERTLQLLSRVAMRDPEGVMRSYPHQLSGGMLQRCVIAMALMGNPALLIMDEPTTALDVTTQAVVLDLVAELKDEFNSAILYITHNLGVVARICNRIGVMYAGELVEQASLRDLFARPRHPYTLELLACVPKPDRRAEKRKLVTIRGSVPQLANLPPGCVFEPRCRFAEPACAEGRPGDQRVDRGAVSAHVTTCRRWEMVPPPGRFLQEAMETWGSELPESTGDDLMAAEGVRVYFKSRNKSVVRAVDGVSLEVLKAQTVGLVGESGCGKTSLARALAGLTPATSGTVTLRGEPLAADVARRPRGQLKDIQMVFQNPDASLNPRRSVGSQIARPLSLLGGLSRAEARERAEAALNMVSLPASYYGRSPVELSGGEKQRAAVARAFASDPGVVFCDEPISSLDVSVQGSLMNLLMELQRIHGTSYLFISHDLSAVQHLSDYVAVMYLGSLVEWGLTDSVLAPPYHPYTEALLSAVPVPDPELGQETIRLPGSVPSAVRVPSGCRFHTRCPRFHGSECETQVPPARAASRDHVIHCHIALDELRRSQADVFLQGTEGRH